MLNQAKSSSNPRRLLTEGTLATAVAQAEPDPPALPDGQAQVIIPGEPLYSIRLVQGPGGLCTNCGKQQTGSGPVGFCDDDPICDLCLLQGTSALGMVLAVISVIRAYANARGTAEEWQAALEEVGAFARIYERIAIKTSPPRIIRIIPDFTRANDSTH